MNHNRVSLLTAPGVAAIAVVRVCGPLVDAFLAQHFSKPTPLARCVHGMLRDGERVIDDALVVRNDDWADLNLHGGIWVVHSIIELAKSLGFELQPALNRQQPHLAAAEHSGGSSGQPVPIDCAANPAVNSSQSQACSPVAEGDDRPSNDCVESSIIWQEVLAALPLAKTELAVRILLAQPDLWENLPTSKAELQTILNDPGGHWLIGLPTVAIIGPPNVGKSTLANQLFGQTRSITADLPGTTRDWVGEIANLDGVAVMLLDTPGQRITTDQIESAAIAESSSQIKAADVAVLVFDASQGIDQAMIEAHPDAILVANKADLSASSTICVPATAPPDVHPGHHSCENDCQSGLHPARKMNALSTVATEGKGIDELRRAIRRRLGFETTEINRLRWWTLCQREALEALRNRSSRA